MKKLEEIKNEVARDIGYISYFAYLTELIENAEIYFEERLSKFIDEVSRRYAKECSEASLEKASENVRMKTKDNIHELSMMDDWSELDKESITNTDNIVLI